MGLSSSTRRRNNDYRQNPSPSQLLSSSSSAPQPHSFPFASSNPPYSLPPPQPPNYVFAANAPYPQHQYPVQNSYPTLPPPAPPPPPPHHSSHYQYTGGYGTCGYVAPMMGRPNYPPYYAHHNNGWAGVRPPVAPLQPPPHYVDYQNTKKIKNDVNVHKDTIRVEADETNPEYHLVSFTFDALVDGRITIFYFAKEEANCKFTPLYPEALVPVSVPFQKGLGQKFCQPQGTGIDLGFFELDDLAKPSPGDVFPLVISAETYLLPLPTEEQLDHSPSSSTFTHAQITQAVLEKNNGPSFQVRVIRQILWVDGARYELQELFGIGNESEEGFNDSDPGKECVICMTEPKDTAVLPCRHMCMCSECAKALRLQTNKCPICRQAIEELIEIKVNKGNQ